MFNGTLVKNKVKKSRLMDDFLHLLFAIFQKNIS